MTVMKAVVRGIVIAVSVSTTSVRAGSMLVLGVTPGNFVSSPNPATPAYSYVPSTPSAFYLPPSPTLRLGMTANPSPIVFQPPQAAPTQFVPIAANPAPLPAPDPVPQVISPPSLPSPPPNVMSPPPVTGAYDAFINLGSGPYSNAGNLTTGNAQPWYLSAPVDRLFGGVPNSQQQAAFDNTVLQRVQQTFGLSGVPVALTLDPNAAAAHVLSVVSQTTNPNLPGAIGMTFMNGNGFHYIDNSANLARSVDQLEWIVAHNVAHELMLAFGVPETHDTTGQFIDARYASWSMITSPTATFSPEAINDLLLKKFQSTSGSVLYAGAQLLGPPTVPEPTTLLLWAGIASAGLVARYARRRLACSKG